MSADVLDTIAAITAKAGQRQPGDRSPVFDRLNRNTEAHNHLVSAHNTLHHDVRDLGEEFDRLRAGWIADLETRVLDLEAENARMAEVLDTLTADRPDLPRFRVPIPPEFCWFDPGAPEIVRRRFLAEMTRTVERMVDNGWPPERAERAARLLAESLE
jgi:hypothetical protein